MRTHQNRNTTCLTPRPSNMQQQPQLLIERITGVKKIGDFAIMTDKLIGKGHYGKVYLAYHSPMKNGVSTINTDRPLVCKVVEREALSAKGEKMIKNEILNLQLIDSPNVIQLLKTFKTATHYYIITELCNGGDVSQLLAAKGGQGLPEYVARSILSKIACGLEDMHTACVLHRDIKLPNILINFECPVPMPDGRKISQTELLSYTSSQKE